MDSASKYFEDLEDKLYWEEQKRLQELEAKKSRFQKIKDFFSKLVKF